MEYSQVRRRIFGLLIILITFNNIASAQTPSTHGNWVSKEYILKTRPPKKIDNRLTVINIQEFKEAYLILAVNAASDTFNIFSKKGNKLTTKRYNKISVGDTCCFDLSHRYGEPIGKFCSVLSDGKIIWQTGDTRKYPITAANTKGLYIEECGKEY